MLNPMLKVGHFEVLNDFQMKMHLSSEYIINSINTCSILFMQKDDVVTVTGPVVASLKCSRFSDEFDYQPVQKKTCDTSACNGSSPDKVSLGFKCKQLMMKICVEFQIPCNLIKIRSFFCSEILTVQLYSDYQNFGAKQRSDFNQIAWYLKFYTHLHHKFFAL